MASTTTTTMTETIYAKILVERLIDAMYSAIVMDPLVRQESLVGRPGLTASFAVWPSLTAASIAEVTDLASTAVDSTAVDIAVTEAASIRIDVTDLLEESTIVSGGAAFAQQGMKAVADKRDADLASLLGAFSGVVGTTGVDLTEANMLDAQTLLARNDAPRPWVYVLHAQQVGDLRRALSTTTAVVWSGTDPDALGEGPTPGFAFPYYGIAVYETTNVPDANAGADHGGALFARGEALARVDKRAIRMEPQRDASLRATEFNITSVYGQGELVDAWGVSIITDHA